MSFNAIIQVLKGGPTSGNFGHSGRKGKRGGSAPGGGLAGFIVPDKMIETGKYGFTIPVKNEAQLKAVLDKHIIDGEKGQASGEYFKPGQGWARATPKLTIGESQVESRESRIKKLVDGYEVAKTNGATAYQARFGTGVGFDFRTVTLAFDGNFDKK